MTQISLAQAGGLLSYDTGFLAIDEDATSGCGSSPSSLSPRFAASPPPPNHAGNSRPGCEQYGFSRTLRTCRTCRSESEYNQSETVGSVEKEKLRKKRNPERN